MMICACTLSSFVFAAGDNSRLALIYLLLTLIASRLDPHLVIHSLVIGKSSVGAMPKLHATEWELPDDTGNRKNSAAFEESPCIDTMIPKRKRRDVLRGR